jgi:enamine deaminase RidA (YjgF/YER057c/UK114 family)
MNKKALLPPGWPRPRGYANGVSARGRTIFVAGMIGWNERSEFASDRLADQARQALVNVVAVLAAGGALPSHIVRMTWYVTDKHEYVAAYPRSGARSATSSATTTSR